METVIAIDNRGGAGFSVRRASARLLADNPELRWKG